MIAVAALLILFDAFFRLSVDTLDDAIKFLVYIFKIDEILFSDRLRI